jgi:teichuronic acid biosynthesis glycosyltransferase TuaG
MNSTSPLKNTLPKVSVIIPTYNRADLLCRAIKSVLSQSYPVHEIVVCDDGSSDDSKEKVLALNSTTVKWFDCGKNGRPAVPRNVGIAESTGDWLAFLDDDDEWLPNKIQEQLNLANIHHAKALCSNAKIRKNGNIQSQEYASHQKELFTFSDLIYSNYIMCSSAMIHRSLLSTIVGFPEHRDLKAIEDYALWIRVSTQCDFYFVKTPLVIYNDAPSNTIRGTKNDTFQQRKIIFENLLQWSEKVEVKKEYVTTFILELTKALDFINEGFFKKILRRIR